MDLNRDGHLDILTGSFPGVPQLIVGSAEGFKEPKSEPVMAADGTTVLIADFRNEELGRWDSTDRANSEGHCTSSTTVDWDDDGDLDLLLGEYENGGLFLRLNEGSDTETRFASTNQPVLVKGKPLKIEGGMAAPCVVDFDQDGLFDIICGGHNGGIFYCHNTGTKTAPLFKSMETLVERVEEENLRNYTTVVPTVDGKPGQPGIRLHVDAVDYDHDGDIDLLVGGKSSWISPDRKKLTPEEQKEVDELEYNHSCYMKIFDKLSKKLRPVWAEMAKMEENEEGDTKKFMALQAHADDLEDLQEDCGDFMELIEEKIAPYEVDDFESGNFVWLYRRK